MATRQRTRRSEADRLSEEEKKRLAEQEDERVRQHGAELAAKARAAVGQPMRTPMTLAEANAIAHDAGEELVIVAVPRPIMLLFDFRKEHNSPFAPYWGSRLDIPEGPQEMPISIAQHQWLLKHGVKPYNAPPVRARDAFTKSDVDEAVKKAVAEALAERDAEDDGEEESTEDDK